MVLYAGNGGALSADVVQKPVQGFQAQGVTGFVKGLANGVFGVVIKPAVGAVDVVTRYTGSIARYAGGQGA